MIRGRSGARGATRRRHRLRSLVDNERGATAFFLAAGMSVFLGATALAVDLGMLATARTEAQAAADAAALAGASALVFVPNDARKAREWATEYARLNSVRGTPVDLREQDVEVIGDTVRVTVLRTGEHGGRVPTTFARILGIYGADVSAVAAAEAAPQAAAVGCLLPLTLADRWVNEGSPEWDPSEGDYYEPPYRPDGSPNPNYVGYGDVGELITLSPSEGGSTSRGRGSDGSGSGPTSSRTTPSQYNLWLPAGVSGTPEVEARVNACPLDDPLHPGDPMWREPGNVQSLVRAFRDILADPKYAGQYYDSGCRCIRDGNNGHDLVTGGLRLRAVPVHDIRTFTEQGSGPHFSASHFIGVFIESIDPGPEGTSNVYARVMPAMGTPAAGPAAGPLVRAVRLVQ